MATYKKFLVKQQTFNGASYTDYSAVIDTYETYKVACQEMPFKILPEVKEPAKREWFDENGEDVYIPATGLKYKSYDVTAKFLYAGERRSMRSNIVGFINFLRGRGVSLPIMLAIYDEYTGIGHRGIYVIDISDDMYEYNDFNENGYAAFSVKFRVTDPVTMLDEELNVVE